MSSRAFWILVAGLVLLTRVPLASEYLSVDNVNLALALERFDLRLHQPHPPGYPFFVGLARLVNVLVGDAGRTFLVISVVVTGLCLPMLSALGTRMFDPAVGRVAVFLLLLNPVFWFSGLEGPLRPHLALFSLLTAYCAWRAWNGERRYVIVGACALGAGSGFRPDLLVYLTPIWLVSAWVGTRSLASLAQGLGVLCVVILTWTGALVHAAGGVIELYGLTTDYRAFMGGLDQEWWRRANRILVWNGLAIIPWVWAAPFVIAWKPYAGLLSSRSAFLLVWLVPGLAFQTLGHVLYPGHTLAVIPVWCLIGALVLRTAARRWETAAPVVVAVALALNVTLFLNYVPVGAAPGLFHTSLGKIRWLDDVVRESLAEVEQFTAPGIPTLIVAQDVHRDAWFMDWRIARYYLPEREIRVVAEQKTPSETIVVRRDRGSPTQTGSPVVIRVPRPARILWLLEHGGRFHLALEEAVPLRRGERLFYTDVGADGPPFRVLDFLFVPG